MHCLGIYTRQCMGKDQENADSRKARTRRILRVSAHAIRDYFTQCKESVFTQHELFALLASKKAEWQLGKSITRQDFLTVLQQRVPLKQLVLKSAKYPSVIRMVRGNPSCFEIGLSLRKGAYISHASAAYLHDLLDTLTVLYINKEQTPKDQSLELTQAGIDTAFARSPRESTLRYRSSDPSDEIEYVLLNGKSTDCLGVVWLTKPDIGRVPVTNLARTLVDLTVRPQYGGGARMVLEAFKKAREGGIVKSGQIAELLREVEHGYPYHQAIGFLMDRAGFSKNDTRIFKTPGMKFDFYLEQKIEKPLYDAEWRIYYPSDLVRSERD